MICILRNWEQQHGSLTSRLRRHHHHHATTTALDGPELLLTPEEVVLSVRDVSPLRYHPRQEQRPPPVPFSIPISDILVVETHRRHPPSSSSSSVRRHSAATAMHQLSITTRSFGVFELNCDGINGHDILLAFLHASLPTERIVDHGKDRASSRTIIRPTSSNVSMDGFTARKVQERGEQETWPEKLSRRMGKVASSFQEMSMTLCDVSSCCQQVQAELLSSRHDGCSNTNNYYNNHERRDPPAMHFNDLGLEEEESSWSSPSVATASNKRGPPKWQYGLSMESEPELESTR